MSDIDQYGRFDAGAGTFTLDSDPPRKWRNIHYNQPGEHEIYAETSNLGDGPVVVRDGAGNTCHLVGYDSKFLYIRDDETNTVFTPWGDPVATAVEGRECVFHAAYTAITGTCTGLRVVETVFVPRWERCEVWRVTVENRTDRLRKVSLFAYAGFQLHGTNSEGQGIWKDNHSRVLPEMGGVFVYNRERAVSKGRFNGFLLTTSPDYAGGSGYRDYFTRESFSLGDPKILKGWNADNRAGVGPDCAGIVQVALELAPGATARADFLIGQAGDSAEATAVRNRLVPAAVDAALDEQIRIETARAAAFTVETGDPSRDGLINHFAKKQMVSYLINKSGFRDNLQNDMGVALFDYPMARANLLRAISSQYASGSVPHSFRPWNRHQYSDKPAWLLHCIPWLIKESGDFSLLDEAVPYCDAPEPESVWQHMLRAMRYLVNDTGAHGLCDQHFADWNDGLEPSEKTGARESVMVTQQLCLGLLEVAEIARRRGEDDIEKYARDWHAHFAHTLNEVAWDGGWYVRSLCADGYALGSSLAAEGRIFLETQCWAVLSQTAPDGRGLACLQAVDRHIENDYGFSLAGPAFTRFDERIGKFSAARPYYAENGGCYNHAAGFKGVADCMLGRAEEAWRTYIKVAPGSPWNPISNSGAEPFAFTNCYSPLPEHPGRAMYPWRTGTAAWFTQLLVEWILGARRHYDGLLLDPCLPIALPTARLTRTFRGAVFDIDLDNTALRGRGVRELWLDGERIEGAILPDLRSGRHRVRVVV